MKKAETRRYLSDATWRRDIAHREFIRAMRTGRMMAFVGSWTTRELGYPGWDELLSETLPFSAVGRAVLEGSHGGPLPADEAWIAAAWDMLKGGSHQLAVYEMLNEFARSNEPIRKGWTDGANEKEFRTNLDAKVDALFSLTRATKRLKHRKSSVWELCRNLGVRRIITTNYDMEFEYELMVDEAEKWRGVTSGDPFDARSSVFDRCRETAKRRRAEAMQDDATMSRFDYAIEHVMADSRSIISDCFQRERSDKLFEFAIGSSYPAWHIMHLHGRISDPETLIISYSDYSRQYRRSSITKLPFEHAMKLLFAGNPILFVGMGMKEEEILSALRQFMVDGHPGYVAPHFVIWSAEGKTVSPSEELFRLRLHLEFGVYVLFDVEIVGYVRKGKKEDQLAPSLAALAGFANGRVRPFSWTDHDPALGTRPLRVPPASGLTQGGDFRDMQAFLPSPSPTPARRAEDLARGSIVWGASNTLVTAPHPRTGRKRFSAIEIEHDRLPSGTGFNNALPWDGSKKQANAYFTHVITGGSPIKAFIDRPGSGHGNLASVVGDFVLEKVADARAAKMIANPDPFTKEMLFFQLNGSFTWELDSAFSLVSGLFDDCTAFRTQQSRSAAAEQFFMQIAAAIIDGKQALPRALVLVINGADRFFDSSGYPLSNELDLLIRRMPQVRDLVQEHVFAEGKHLTRDQAGKEADEKIYNFIRNVNGGVHPVTLLLFGTGRVGRYLASLGFERGDFGVDRIADFDIISSTPEPFASSEPVPGTFFSQLAERETREHNTGPFVPGRVKSLYLSSVASAFDKALPAGRFEQIVPQSLRTALERFEQSQETDTRRPFFDIYLDAGLLTEVLSRDKVVSRERAVLALEMLRTMAFLGQPTTVATLAVAMEGARSTPGSPPGKIDRARLTRTMNRLLELNLVLEIEQFPGLVSTSRTYRRFGLHRALLHEIRDRNSVPFSDARNYTSFNIPLLTAQPIDDHEPEERVQRVMERMIRHLIEERPKTSIADPEYGMQLRAACASLRSYYTTSTLLMHEPEPAPSDRQSSRLPDHANLIDELIHWAEESARELRTGGHSGPPSFFPDDLVWLHAQRGVALMAFGDLYGARDSLGKAASINDDFVEFGDHGQNWRRIQLNQIHLDIERAKIASAEARIRDLKASINRAVDDDSWMESWRGRTGEKKPRNAFEAIMQAYGAEPRLRVREVDRFFAADLILSAGLACGYRGWCEYLRGRLRTAEHYFEHCIQILRNIGEQRAYSLFARHYAALLDAIGKCDEGREILMLCQAAADSTRQMDISHLAGLTRAEHRFAEADPAERAHLLQSVNKTLRYATLTDMYRVRLEARRVLALMRFRDGDYDGALEHASEALAVAARFGFTLRKIALRILVGEILVKRGDPISGTSMLEQALRIADRLGYQRAVEEAWRVRTGNIAGQDR